MNHSHAYCNRINRLIRLQGSDPGFTVLAVHSFIEAYARERLNRFSRDDYYNDLVRHLRVFLSLPRDLNRVMWDLVGDLMSSHRITNDVRHQFAELTNEDVRAVFYMLEKFIGLVGIGCMEQVVLLKKSLEIWESRTSHYEDSQKLISIERDLQHINKSAQHIENELEEWMKLAEVQEALQTQIDNINEELKTSNNIPTQLHNQKTGLRGQVHELSSKMEKIGNANLLINSLLRLSGLSRTRRDFERNATRLTPEQRAIVDDMDFHTDILIEGGPGTGKSLVLIEGIRKLLNKRQDTIAEIPKQSFVLLTYTNALVKYDRYLATIMVASEGAFECEINTVDRFFLDKLKKIEPNAHIVYNNTYIENYLKEIGVPGFITLKQLASEIDDIIFGFDLSKEEYIEKSNDLTGEEFNQSQREIIWNISKKLDEMMYKNGQYTKNYSRRLLFHYYMAVEDIPDTNDFIFVDEIQDLLQIEIELLSILKNKVLCIAGDVGQSIYVHSNKIPEIDSNSKIKKYILHTNFRNTEQIGFIATAFKQARIADSSTDKALNSFRHGPTPELHQLDDWINMERILLNRIRLLHTGLGYTYENIGIIASTKNTLEKIKNLMTQHNLPTAQIIGDSFSFEDSKGIRLTTIHSSKGLEIPAAILVLDKLPGAKDGNMEALELLHNLVFVAITRAMDYLSIIMNPNELDDIGKDIVKAFEQYNSEWLSSYSKGEPA